MKYLITLVLLSSCIGSGDVVNNATANDIEQTKKPSRFNLTCEQVGSPTVKAYRCQNKEVVCYQIGDSTSCLPKRQKTIILKFRKKAHNQLHDYPLI